MKVLLLTFVLAAQGVSPRPVGPPPVGIEVASRALQPAELMVVTMTFGDEPSEVTVRAFGKSFPTFSVGPRKHRALVGIGVDQKPGKYTLDVEAKVNGTAVHGRHAFVVEAKAFGTRSLKVPPEFVNPPQEVQERIARDARAVREAYAHPSTDKLWQPPFVRPVADVVSSVFGRLSILNGTVRSRHLGTDFASAEGTPIEAPNTGRVVLGEPLYLSGNTVIIDHGLGLFSMLAHMSKIDVERGQVVKAGQIVGRVGATGRVTGPHLHWSLRVADTSIDPLSALALLQ